jgi:hypothetical protein
VYIWSGKITHLLAHTSSLRDKFIDAASVVKTDPLGKGDDRVCEGAHSPESWRGSQFCHLVAHENQHLRFVSQPTHIAPLRRKSSLALLSTAPPCWQPHRAAQRLVLPVLWLPLLISSALHTSLITIHY